MKRPLVYAAGGFVLGEVWLLLPVEFMAVIPIVMLFGVFLLWRRQKIRGYAVRSGRSLIGWLLPFLIFGLFGAARLEADRRQEAGCEETAEMFSGRTVRLYGTVKDVRDGNGESYEAALEIDKVKVYASAETDAAAVTAETEMGGTAETDMADAADYAGSVLVYLDEAPDMEILRIGMRVSVRGELERMGRASNPGEFDYGGYYHAIGIEGRMFGESLRKEGEEYSPYLDFIFRLKRRAGEVLEQVCDETDYGVFRAAALGDKTALTESVRELYQKNGIAHLLAVSGLHISLIGMGFYRLLRRSGAGFNLSGGLAAALTVSYGILTGGSASVVRAVSMVCLQLLADRLGRTYDLLSALAASALLLLIRSPALLFQAGFQLSFGAVLSIGAVAPVLEEWAGAGRGFRQTVLLGIALQIVTLPMTAYHFYEYPVYSSVLNLLVIPLMGYVLVSGLAGIFCGALWLPAGRFAVGTGHYILMFYEWLCLRFERMPGAVQIVGRPQMRQLALYLLLWAVFLCLASRSAGRERKKTEASGGKEAGKHARRDIVRFCTLGICTVIGYIILLPVPVSGLRATFLDVGQGDGICLESRGAVVLVDGGSTSRRKLGEQVLEPFLKSRGIRMVDYAVVSHGDEDHISGIRELLESDCGIQIGCLVLPELAAGDERYDGLLEAARQAGTEVVWMKAGDRIEKEAWLEAGEAEPISSASETASALRIRCLYAGDDSHARDTNDHSLLLEVSFGQAGFLLTGDISAEGERRWLAQTAVNPLSGPVQILKAAHHGSDYSSCREFLEYVSPKWAIISCGENNRYGHPGAETVKRLEDQGIICFYTMKSGAVTVVTDGRKASVFGFTDRYPFR